MAEILRVEDLTKYFATKKGTLHAVDGVTFGLREGQTLGSWENPAAESLHWAG